VAALLPVSGIYGRVTKGGVAIAALNSWQMTRTTQPVLVYTFEAVIDSDNNTWPNVLQGVSVAKCTFEGVFDLNNAPDSSLGIRNGIIVEMSFILIKATPFGFNQVLVFVENLVVSTKVENQAAQFQGAGTIQGYPGSTQVVTG
jgi:hypothetical protein